MKPKQPKPTKAQLKRQAMEFLSGQAHVYHFADAAIGKASVKHMMASGVVLTITALGGRELVAPVLIRDGLSEETIDAIKSDLRRSYDLAVRLKPKQPEELK